MSRRATYAWCSHCRQAPPKGHGLCQTCLTFQRDHGRLPEASEIRKRTCHACQDCGDLVAGRGKYCQACNHYRRRGRRRPRYLWDPTVGCANCGKPLAADCAPKSGYCAACYQYEYDYGVSRPRRLWGVGKFGWCDCGQPAVTRVEVPRLELRADARTGRLRLAGNAEQTITFALCADCLALEEEMAA